MADLTVHPHLRRIEVDTPKGVVTYSAPARDLCRRAAHLWPGACHRRAHRDGGTARAQIVMSETLDLDHLRQWIGRSAEATDTVTAHLVMGLRATLFQEIGEPKDGDAAPFTVHWCLGSAGVSDVDARTRRPSHPRRLPAAGAAAAADVGRRRAGILRRRCASAMRPSAPRKSRT